MKIWVFLNEIQQGPYTLEEFAQLPVTPSTPVWYEGLDRWMPAGEAPATAAVFNSVTEAEEPAQSAVQHTGILHDAGATYSAGRLSLNDTDDINNPCPPTFIGWSIFVLICCFPIGGILGLVFSNMVSSAYRSGDYRKAAKMSEAAEWTIILSIVIGLMAMPLTMLMF